MEIAIIISTIACIVAIYNIFPDHAKVTLRYRASKLKMWVLGILTFAIIFQVIAISFFTELYRDPQNIGILCSPNFCGYEFNELFLTKALSVISIIIISVVFFQTMRSKQLAHPNSFFIYLESLMAGGKHGKVVELLLVYGDGILRSLSTKEKLPTEDNLLTIIRSGKKLGTKEKLKNRAVNFSNRKTLTLDKTINENLKRILSNDHLIDSITEEAPYLGVKIIDSKLDLETRKAFSEKYLARLFSDRKSILHMEFSNFNDALAEPIGYYIDPKFSLIQAITNPKTAQSMQFNKSIGEESINFIRSKEFISDINDLDILVDEENLKKYPLYSGIRYIDILVMEALKIQHPWHMWLFYFPHVVSGIC